MQTIITLINFDSNLYYFFRIELDAVFWIWDFCPALVTSFSYLGCKREHPSSKKIKLVFFFRQNKNHCIRKIFQDSFNFQRPKTGPQWLSTNTGNLSSAQKTWWSTLHFSLNNSFYHQNKDVKKRKLPTIPFSFLFFEF